MSDDERQATFERVWEIGGLTPWVGSFNDILKNERSNRAAYEFWRDKTRARINDPAVAEILAPTEPVHPFGTKRPSLEQNFFEIFNQPNVSLVDLRKTPIERVTRSGITTTAGEHRPGCSCPGHRFRCDNWRADQHRDPRHAGRNAAGEVGDGRSHPIRNGNSGISKSPLRLRPAQPERLSPTGQPARSFRATGSSSCWTTFANAIARGSRRRSRRRKPGGRKCIPWRTRLSSHAPSPGIWARTFQASRARCCRSPVVFRHIWRSATRARNEGTRDSRSAEVRLSSGLDDDLRPTGESHSVTKSPRIVSAL